MSEVAPNSLSALDAAGDSVDEASIAPATRKRPKPGERRLQILKALASMLEKPGADRVTTAALAARLEVSEAALYRHFASKAQMFEGLIEFIEQSVFTLAAQIAEHQKQPPTQAAQLVTMLLHFAEKNPGMTRVMVGDALVFENDRLQQRMNQFFDRIEASLRDCLRSASPEDSVGAPTAADIHAQASVLTAFAMGRLQRFARSDFKRLPSEFLEQSLARML